MNGIPRRRLGRTDLNVSAIGMGGVGIGGLYSGTVTDDDAVNAVELALASGINFLDTSPLYDQSERRFGLALRGVDRNTYFLSTKTGTHPKHPQDYSWDGTHWSVENSLKLCGVDYFDVLLVHDPRQLKPVLGPRGALEALQSLRADGVVRNIGLGQRRHDFHAIAIDSGLFDVILTYNDYHPTRTTALTSGLLQHAAEHHIGVLNGSPMAFGMLSGGDPRQMRNADLADRDTRAAIRLWDWCQARRVDIRAVTLQTSLRQDLVHCTLTGAKNPDEIAINLAAIAEPIPESLWDELAALNLTEGQV